jgi:hypothetical protein
LQQGLTTHNRESWRVSFPLVSGHFPGTVAISMASQSPAEFISLSWWQAMKLNAKNDGDSIKIFFAFLQHFLTKLSF